MHAQASKPYVKIRSGFTRTITRSSGVWKSLPAVLVGELVDVLVGAVHLELGNSLDFEVAVRVVAVEDGDADPRVAAQVLALGAPVGRVEDDVLAVGVDPDDARLRHPVPLQRRDGGEALASQQLEVLVGQRSHRSPHFTVVGMFLILPAAISFFTCSTLAAMPAGAFGENFPMPTPPTSSP